MPFLEIQECQDLLSQVGAYFGVGQTGEHYRLGSSGFHVGNFYDLSRAFQYRNVVEYWGRLLARGINNEMLRLFQGVLPTVDSEGPLVILAPAFGGIPLQYALAATLPVNDVRILTLKKNKSDLLEIPSWFEHKPNMVGIFIDDLIATGGTLRATMKAFPGLVVAVAVGIDRTFSENFISIPKFAISRDPEPIYEPGSCPWCKKGIPIVSRPKSKIIFPPHEESE